MMHDNEHAEKGLMASLLDQVESIRKHFFPDWDTERQWSVVVKDDPAEVDPCVPERKELQVPKLEQPEHLTAYIVHAVCLAQTENNSYDDDWANLMEQVATQAEKDDWQVLARMIREEMKQRTG